MRIISCLTGPGWWRLMKLYIKTSIRTISRTWVVELLIYNLPFGCIDFLTVTFISMSLLFIVALVAGWSSSLGVHEYTLSSSPLTFSSSLLLVLHIFIDLRLSANGCQPAFFQPLLTQMNNRSRLLSGSLLHFLIHFHDSIYLPGKRDFRHREHFCVLLAGGSF